MSKKFSLGIDPGFTETGLVLRLDGQRKQILEGVVLSCRPNGSAFMRTLALCDQITDYIGAWIDLYEILYIDITIERPIYNQNPDSFEKQWRLVQAIESQLVLMPIMAELDDQLLREYWLTEVMPSTSKKLATGDGKANKYRVARVSPFLEQDFEKRDTWQTLGDAWSHSLAAWGDRHYARVDLNNLTMPVVKKIV